MDFRLKSSAFDEGGNIPERFTCDGENISPPLQWEYPPEGTASFALIAEDLDTPLGTICHWVLYNIPSSTSELPAGIPHQISLADGTCQGTNMMQRHGYMGPCPPWGTHRYTFKIYALDTILKPVRRMGRRRLRRAIEGHILVRACLMGRYSRSSSA